MNNPEFFNILDYIWLTILFASLFIGFSKGFIKDFFGTFAWVISAFLSSLFSPYFLPTISQSIPNLLVAKCVTSVVTFSILLLAFKLIVNILSENVKRTFLSALDRLFGVCFGFVRGVSILLTITLLALFFGIQQDRFKVLEESKVSTLLYRIANILMPSVEKIIGTKFPRAKVVKPKVETLVDGLSKAPIASKRNTKKKVQEVPEDTSIPAAVEKLKDYVAEVLSTQYISKEGRIEEERHIERHPEQQQEQKNEEEPTGLKVFRHINKKPEVDKYKKVRPKYGFMHLLDAKKKRLEELRKQRVKKHIKRYLDKEMSQEEQ